MQPTHSPASQRRRSTMLAAVTALAVVGAGFVASQPLSAQARPTPPVATGAIAWGACPPVPPAQVAAGFARDPQQTCGTLRVPMDYRNPGGGTIEVAVSKIPAADPARRRGVLLTNPGGPGGAGLDIITLLKGKLPAEVVDRYDIIGFDPRGVGRSTPITCGRDIKEVTRHLDKLMPYPDANGSIRGNVAYGRELARDCAAATGPVLPFITTANTARDMDRIRAALGERRVSYYGLSYGTYLGAVYASLFPHRTDRVVLDSSVDPALRDDEDSQSYGEGMEDRFPDLARFAVKNARTVGFGNTEAKVRAKYLAVADRLQRKPAKVAGSPIPLNGNLVRLFTFLLAHDDANLPTALGPFWHAAGAFAAGSATPKDAAVVAGIINQFAGQATTPGVPDDNFNAVGTAVLCNDSAWPRNVRRYARNVAWDRIEHPLTAGMPYNVWPCTFWKTQPIEPPVRVTDAGPRNVLIVQNQRDEATPLSAAQGMRRALGGRSVLVDVDAGGHGVLIATKQNACALSTLGAFLAHGKLPRRDVSCAGS